eukprot:TRINITY_DN11878_c0_g2_i1.p1 TRINITY_DN11878_c0_g2~~TRINITY_DN11878_c0_g2_i1.p1  ORF type:complete len:706 (+),score=137.70 TRINITY_DN11878_c0_g2_i1:49-2166(+)
MAAMHGQRGQGDRLLALKREQARRKAAAAANAPKKTSPSKKVTPARRPMTPARKRAVKTLAAAVAAALDIVAEACVDQGMPTQAVVSVGMASGDGGEQLLHQTLTSVGTGAGSRSGTPASRAVYLTPSHAAAASRSNSPAPSSKLSTSLPASIVSQQLMQAGSITTSAALSSRPHLSVAHVVRSQQSQPSHPNESRQASPIMLPRNATPSVTSTAPVCTAGGVPQDGQSQQQEIVTLDASEVDAILRTMFDKAKAPEAEGLTYDEYVGLLKGYGACEGLQAADDVLATTRPPAGRLITWNDFTICLKIVALRRHPHGEIEEATEQVVVDLVSHYLAEEDMIRRQAELEAIEMRRVEALGRGEDPDAPPEEQAADQWDVSLSACPEEVLGMFPTSPRTPQACPRPHRAQTLPEFVNGIGSADDFAVVVDDESSAATEERSESAVETVRRGRLRSPPRPAPLEPVSQLWACTTPVSLKSEPSKAARGSALEGSIVAWSDVRSHPPVAARQRLAADVRASTRLLESAKARVESEGGDGWVPPEMVLLFKAYLAYCAKALEGRRSPSPPRPQSPALAPDGQPLPAVQRTQQHLFCTFAEATFDLPVPRGVNAPRQTSLSWEVLKNMYARHVPAPTHPDAPHEQTHPLDFPSFVVCVLGIGQVLFPASPPSAAEQLVLQVGLNAIGCPLGLCADNDAASPEEERDSSRRD